MSWVPSLPVAVFLIQYAASWLEGDAVQGEAILREIYLYILEQLGFVALYVFNWLHGSTLIEY